MKRTHLNLAVDILAFAAFLLLTSTGILLRFQLPPGSGGHAGHGTGIGAGEQTVLTLWGWSRHDWGTFHFWVACSMLAIMAVHLFLHWKWIVCVIRGKSSDYSGYRLGLGAFGLAALILLAFAPSVSPITQQTRADLLQESNSASPTKVLTEQLRGSMTLDEISELAGVSPDDLIQRLGLPAETSTTERVGRLLRAQGRQMDDLREPLREIIALRSEQDNSER